MSNLEDKPLFPPDAEWEVDDFNHYAHIPTKIDRAPANQIEEIFYNKLMAPIKLVEMQEEDKYPEKSLIQELVEEWNATPSITSMDAGARAYIFCKMTFYCTDLIKRELFLNLEKLSGNPVLKVYLNRRRRTNAMDRALEMYFHYKFQQIMLIKAVFDKEELTKEEEFELERLKEETLSLARQHSKFNEIPLSLSSITPGQKSLMERVEYLRREKWALVQTCTRKVLFQFLQRWGELEEGLRLNPDEETNEEVLNWIAFGLNYGSCQEILEAHFADLLEEHYEQTRERQTSEVKRFMKNRYEMEREERDDFFAQVAKDITRRFSFATDAPPPEEPRHVPRRSAQIKSISKVFMEASSKRAEENQKYGIEFVFGPEGRYYRLQRPRSVPRPQPIIHYEEVQVTPEPPVKPILKTKSSYPTLTDSQLKAAINQDQDPAVQRQVRAINRKVQRRMNSQPPPRELTMMSYTEMIENYIENMDPKERELISMTRGEKRQKFHRYGEVTIHAFMKEYDSDHYENDELEHRLNAMEARQTKRKVPAYRAMETFLNSREFYKDFAMEIGVHANNELERMQSFPTEEVTVIRPPPEYPIELPKLPTYGSDERFEPPLSESEEVQRRDSRGLPSAVVFNEIFQGVERSERQAVDVEADTPTLEEMRVDAGLPKVPQRFEQRMEMQREFFQRHPERKLLPKKFRKTAMGVEFYYDNWQKKEYQNYYDEQEMQKALFLAWSEEQHRLLESDPQNMLKLGIRAENAKVRAVQEAKADKKVLDEMMRTANFQQSELEADINKLWDKIDLERSVLVEKRNFLAQIRLENTDTELLLQISKEVRQLENKLNSLYKMQIKQQMLAIRGTNNYKYLADFPDSLSEDFDPVTVAEVD